MIRITVTTDRASKDLDIPEWVFEPDSRGEYLDDESRALAVVNAVADAIKELNESK